MEEEEALIAQINLPSGQVLLLKAGNILEFEGDAIVNAANEGGVGGFGVDEAINRAAGDFEIKQQRKKFNGIPTGEAKTTDSFKHDKCKWIIHAVGPVYRTKFGQTQTEEDMKQKDTLLRKAYESVLKQAQDRKVGTLGICILSAGVFRGEKPLSDVIFIAVRALQDLLPKYLSIKEATLIAYTQEEKRCMSQVYKSKIATC